MRRRKIKPPVVTPKFTPFVGGLNVVTPMIKRNPGSLRQSQNVYQGVNGGYEFFQGYEAFDGRAKPSAAVYVMIAVTVTGTIALGDVLTDNIGTTYGTVIALPTDEIVLTKNTGTWAAGNIKVGAVVVGTTTGLTWTEDLRLNAIYNNLAADIYRADIAVVAGSGDVLGIWYYDGTWYAFRNNAGGTAVEMFKHSATGWTLVPLGTELAFTSGGSYTPQEGDTITGATSGATATLTRVVLEGGIWDGTYRLDFTSGGTVELEVGDLIVGETGGATATLTGVTVSSGGWDETKTLAYTSGGPYEIQVGDMITGETSNATAEVESISTTSGWWPSARTLDFTSGGTFVIQAGDVITGATSLASATVTWVNVTSGSFAGGDAAGVLSFSDQDGVFQAENLDVGANANVVTIAGDSTETGQTAAGNMVIVSQSGTFQAENLRVGTSLNIATISGDSVSTGADAAGYVSFESQTGTFESETIKVGTDLNIATIASNSTVLTGQTAEGKFIFASDTGTFQAEFLKVGSHDNIATIAGDASAITFAVPGGRFEFLNTNYTGSLDTKRMYGVDGKNRGFEFDSSVFVPISTGMVSDAPEHIYSHTNHLFYSYFASAQHSSTGLPYQWSPVTGSDELGMGDSIIGFLSMPGSEAASTLSILTRDSIGMLYGTGTNDWNLVHYKKEAGAIEWTQQLIGNAFMLDDRGITKLQTSQAYGNFNNATVSNLIKPWLKDKKTQVTASCIVREKNQYWIFFADKSAICCTVDNGEIVALMPMYLKHKVTCICSTEDNDGNEVIMFGSDDGFVYEFYKGTSMNGESVEIYFDTAFNYFGSQTTVKRFRRGLFECSGEGYAEFRFNYELEYATSKVKQPAPKLRPLLLSEDHWDEGNWDSFTWDGFGILPASFPLLGSASNISYRIQSNIDFGYPVSFAGITTQFTPTRIKKHE